MGIDSYVYAERREEGRWRLIGSVVNREQYFFLQSGLSYSEWQRIKNAAKPLIPWPEELPTQVYTLRGNWPAMVLCGYAGRPEEREALYGPGYERLFTRPYPRDLSREMQPEIETWVRYYGGSWEEWQKKTDAHWFLLSDLLAWNWEKLGMEYSLEKIMERMLDSTENGEDVRLLCWFVG